MDYVKRLFNYFLSDKQCAHDGAGYATRYHEHRKMDIPSHHDGSCCSSGGLFPNWDNDIRPALKDLRTREESISDLQLQYMIHPQLH